MKQEPILMVLRASASKLISILLAHSEKMSSLSAENSEAQRVILCGLSKIIEDLSSLTVAEATELSKQLEEKWGVTQKATAPAAVGGAAPAEDKDDFNHVSFCRW